ncbi:aspartyl-phosphate phosphatase Spo0E family protein [Peribacillus tepidiphilus]|uniref:aspartyl-phosphate phosphatase Spo0E family protein n=1 Tax=Peribacillus tepidiphilus TaxID=2652445 RepID=UPI0012929C16|nr:aspartyl-phosphate phosphatase Spo0E family protein [Peribacillus tepidiphilus]
MIEKTLELLSNEIHMKRQEMMSHANKYGLTNDKTILFSQELDKLINEYQQIKRSSKHGIGIKINFKKMSFILNHTVSNLKVQ